MHSNKKHNQFWKTCALALVVTGTGLMWCPSSAHAQRARRQAEPQPAQPAPAAATPTAGEQSGQAASQAASSQASDMAASQLLTRGEELLSGGETERGLKMIETVYEQHPSSPIRYRAYLALGKYYLAGKDQAKAIGYLRNARTIEGPDRSVPENLQDVYLESFFLMGVAFFEQRQYASAFPLLRRITEDFPNTVWANQSYYYIGMCHFAQENWAKAIEALSMVGTFIPSDSPSVDVVEAGRRFYVKVTDADLPVLTRMGQSVVIELTTKSGDKETITCVPLPGSTDTFIGSLPTELGVAKPNDGTIQVVGGDTITTRYIDANTQDGKKQVTKTSTSRVVSTAGLNFMLGDLETPTGSAFAGQPVFLVLSDSDLDTSPAADTVSVRLVARAKQSPDDTLAVTDATSSDQAEQYVIRDEVTITLTEQGASPTHTGRFTGKVDVVIVPESGTADKADGVLNCVLGDEIVAYYNDEVHALGNAPRQIESVVVVISEIENRPRATQYIVDDPVISARKNIVEATAFLELAQIFRSLGLNSNGASKADEGLMRVDPIIKSTTKLPPALVEQAFKTKWELQLAKDDQAGAIATCEMFNRLFPESPFVDQALMGIARSRFEEKKYPEAIAVYQRVLRLPNSLSKAEAAFRIAEAGEENAKARSGGRAVKGGNMMDGVINQYKLVADKYRDSEFAGPALAKMVDYYYEAQDYNQATDLLTQIFQDYPDGSFLDAMLLKWAMVAFRMGDYRKAFDKCQELMFDYPDSPHAKRAKEVLPRIEALLNKK